jgi:small subunit ribosomal protein S29
MQPFGCPFVPYRPPAPSPLPRLQLSRASTQLSEEDIGAYYPLDPALLPEAYRPFHQAFYAPRPPALQRKGGCKGLQAEQAASGTPRLMYRAVLHQLLTSLQQAAAEGAASSTDGRSSSSKDGSGAPSSSISSSSSSSSRGQGRRWLLTGPAGCGKSLALLGAVEWARAAGW